MARQDRTPGLGGDEAVQVSEPVAERKPRVLMLTDITSDRTQGGEVSLAFLRAEDAGLDEPVLLDVDDVGVDGVLKTLRAARNAGDPFDILVEDIWSRAGLLESAKAQQPGLYTIVVCPVISATASSLREDPLVDDFVYKDGLEPGFQLKVALDLAIQAIEPEPAPLAA